MDKNKLPSLISEHETAAYSIVLLLFILLLCGCQASMMKTPKSMDGNSLYISSGAVTINIILNAKVEQGAVQIKNNIFVSSDTFKVDKLQLLWGK